MRLGGSPENISRVIWMRVFESGRPREESNVQISWIETEEENKIKLVGLAKSRLSCL